MVIGKDQTIKYDDERNLPNVSPDDQPFPSRFYSVTRTQFLAIQQHRTQVYFH